MKSVRIATALTAVNLLLLLSQAAPHATPASADEREPTAADVAPVLRARSLEIVDDHNRIRALLAVMPPATVDGKDYPETVLLRLIDPQSGPVVKLTAAANGAALGLSDDEDGGVAIFARDDGSYVKITNQQGQEKRVEP
jgi:hypothetical protein